MKKKLLIVLFIIILFVGGYVVLNEYQKKQLVNEAQEKAVEYVENNYKDIKTVQVSNRNNDFSSMGTVGIGGNINNEDRLTFYITFLIENNEVGEVQTIVEAHDFPDRKDGE